MLALFTFPWYLSFLIAIFLLFYFDNYVEIVFFGLFFDILYGGRGMYNISYPYVFFVVFLFVWVVSFKLKDVLKFYK